MFLFSSSFFFQAEDGIRGGHVTGVQTCALPIFTGALPQYSGGLGILAGDHLKSASDLGAPIVGVGLLYHSGYFKQALTRDGWQVESYPVLDPDGLPLTLLREQDGTPARVTLDLPGGRTLAAYIWVA